MFFGVSVIERPEISTYIEPQELASQPTRKDRLMKKGKIAYYGSTGLFSLLIGFGAIMYFVQHGEVAKAFTKLGYPTYIIYPFAVAKILGLVAIWTKRSNTLKEWAYAGFFFELTLAVSAHISVQDGQFAPAAVGLVLLFTSYFTEKYTVD